MRDWIAATHARLHAPVSAEELKEQQRATQRRQLFDYFRALEEAGGDLDAPLNQDEYAQVLGLGDPEGEGEPLSDDGNMGGAEDEEDAEDAPHNDYPPDSEEEGEGEGDDADPK